MIAVEIVVETDTPRGLQRLDDLFHDDRASDRYGFECVMLSDLTEVPDDDRTGRACIALYGPVEDFLVWVSEEDV